MVNLLTVHIGDLAPEQGMTIRYDVYLRQGPSHQYFLQNNAEDDSYRNQGAK